MVGGIDKLLEGDGSVLWFVLLFLPGFISAAVFRLLVASERHDFSKDICEVAAFSLLNFAVFAPVLFGMARIGWLGRLWVLWLSTYVVLIIAPAGWAFLARWLRDQPWTPFLSCQSKAWDYYFSHKEPLWIVAYLDDGSKVAGFYAGESYASAFPSEEQIYIQQEWVVGENDAFERAVTGSDGILLNGRDIKRLVFYKFDATSGDGDCDDREG